MSDSRIKVMVMYGGKSTEHEVSCRSAAFVLRNLNPQKYDVEAIGITKQGHWLKQSTPKLLEALKTSATVPIETNEQALVAQSFNEHTRVVFPVIHGTGGEDGTIQGLMDLNDVPYVGPDLLGSAIGMDKIVAKKLALAAGVPIVPYVEIKLQQWKAGDQAKLIAETESKLGYPMFVKPARLGSSVGVNKSKNRDDLKKHISTAFEFDDKLLIEKGMNVREIEIAALGDYDPDLSIPGEVMPTADFYSYDAKYIDADGAKMAIPAQLTPEQTKTAQDLAKKTFQALELYGMARIDLFLERETGKFYLNEVNTIPGMTAISQYPMLWKASGVEAGALLDRLIELAIKRHKDRSALRKSI